MLCRMEREVSDHLAKGMVAAFYAAGAGHASWPTVLGMLKTHWRARRVELVVLERASDVESFWIGEPTPLTREAHGLFVPSQAPIGQWFVADADAGLCVVNLWRDDVHQIQLGVWADPFDGAWLGRYGDTSTRFLLWHLTKAMDLFLRERVSRRLGESALDVLNHVRRPAWLIDRSRRIHFQNGPARQMLAEAAFFNDRLDTLRCAREGDDSRLSGALQALFERHPADAGCSDSANDRFLIRLPGASTAADGLTLHGRALSADRVAHGVDLALLVACRPEAHAPIDPKWIAEALGLTPAEAKVAVGLAQGDSLNQMSTSGGLSIYTLRSQAHAAMTKTGCHRQNDLISLVLRTQKAQRVDDAVDF